MHSWKVAYLRWQSSTHRLIQKKSSTHWFNSAWEKKKQPLFSRVNLVYDCVDISPPHRPSIFFFFTITYRLSSHCFFTFPLGVGTIATHKFQIPIIENKSQKQKVLPTSSPMYKAKQKTNSIKKKNTYK